MKTVRVLYHLARADLIERIRRYSFLVMLGLVLWLGYLAATGEFRLTIGVDYAGVVDSAWVGATMAMTTNCVLGLVGFYIVTGSVARDYITGVGQIMATTPMSGRLYLVGKWLSNYAVLGITVVVLAMAGIMMQLWFGQGRLDMVAMVSPLVHLSLPWLGLIAAVAVLFESVTWLRGGLGNAVYAVLFLILFPASYLPLVGWTRDFRVNPFVDPAGMLIIGDSVSRSASAVYPVEAGFSFGILGFSEFQLFPYLGIRWTAGILASRLLLLLLAVALVMLAGRWFDRFNPARLVPTRRKGAAAEPVPAPAVEPIPLSSVRLTPLAGASARFRFGALLVGEFKLFLKGQRWWWYAVAAGLMAAQLVSQYDALPHLLIVAWVWPTLILSGLGCRENRLNTRQIVFSAPRPLSQLLAGWLPAALVIALLGSGAWARFLLTGDLVAVLGWLIAIVFIPSLALALGTLTGSGKAFEALYVLWMYLLTQGSTPAIDFAGLIPGSRFVVYAPAAAGLVAVATLARWRQLRAG